MSKLHLFYPENDLALARNLEHYTAPPAAVRLRMSGALLGLWYGVPGDRVVDYGTDSRWYRNARTRYALGPELYAGDPSGLEAAPWGWSRASRLEFERLGFSKDKLPTDATLDRMRELSHRRTSSLISQALSRTLDFPIAPAACELTSYKAVEEYVRKTGDSVLKLPWSSSGRGLILCNPTDLESHKGEIEGLLKRQATLMGEPKLNKTLDFALLFTMHDGHCTFDGYSVFRTVQFGSYAGNILAPQAALHAEIEEKVPKIDRITEALPPIIEEIIGRDYDGTLGVDMIAVDGAEYDVSPAVELNLRMTMGHVCRLFYDLHVVDGATGMFSVMTEGSGVDDTCIVGTRISSGRLSLSPPHSPFSFQVTLNPPGKL